MHGHLDVKFQITQSVSYSSLNNRLERQFSEILYADFSDQVGTEFTSSTLRERISNQPDKRTIISKRLY